MPLHHFRKRQKLIYWIVALLVIPSFTLLWGVGSMSGSSVSDGGARARVFGTTYSDFEFHQFRTRLRAAIGGQGLRFVLGGGMFSPQEHPDISVLFGLAALQQAETLDLRVPDVELGTYLRQHPRLAKYADNEKELTNALDRLIAEHNITRSQFIQGIREWLLIRKFIQLTDDSALATPDSAYVSHAQQNSKFTYKHLTVHVTEEVETQSYNALLGITKDVPEGDEELLNHTINTFLAEAHKNNDRRFWSKAQWRFEYVFAPFDAYKDPKVTEKELRTYFEENKRNYLEKKTFEEARENVLEDVLKEKQKDFAEATLARGDLENYIHLCITEEKLPVLAEIGNLEGLKQRGVTVGISGDTPLSTTAMKNLEVFGESRDLVMFLDKLDEMKDAEKRTEEIERLKKYFDGNRTPLASDKGCLRIRLLEYIPGQPRTLKNKEGVVDKPLRTEVLLELQQKKSMELCKTIARGFADQIEKGDIKTFEKQLETEIVSFRELPESLRTADLMKTALEPVSKGWKIMLLTERNIPTMATYQLEPEESRRNDIRGAQSGLRGRSYFLRMGMVIPGVRLNRWFQEALKTKAVKLHTRQQDNDESADA